jgi:hypothetical protein
MDDKSTTNFPIVRIFHLVDSTDKKLHRCDNYYFQIRATGIRCHQHTLHPYITPLYCILLYYPYREAEQLHTKLL